jgi:hypothetical protein
LVLEWVENRMLRLCADGGRFNGRYTRGGGLHNPDHVLFDLPFPLPTGREKALFGSDVHGSIDEYLMKSDLGDGPVCYYRLPGHDEYLCKRPERGFCWSLMRDDYRHRFIARVRKVRKKKGKVAWLDLTLLDTGHRLGAPAGVAEPDDAGRTRPYNKGAAVRIVLNDELEVDRLWPAPDESTR